MSVTTARPFSKRPPLDSEEILPSAGKGGAALALAATRLAPSPHPRGELGQYGCHGGSRRGTGVFGTTAGAAGRGTGVFGTTAGAAGRGTAAAGAGSPATTRLSRHSSMSCWTSSEEMKPVSPS
eukprot:445869-Alexandrium_andersonii.AAC.1